MNILKIKQFLLNKSTLSLLFLTSFLSACVFPENFDVNVIVNPDASYKIYFEGKLVSVSHLNSMVKLNQPLIEEQVMDLKQKAVEMTVDNDQLMSKAKYIGNGRFSLTSNESYKAGTRTSFLSSLMIDPTNDGRIAIYAAPISNTKKDSLKKIGLNMKGKLSVTLPRNINLISTNSKIIKRSYISNLFTYSWNINDISDEPEITFEIK